MAYLSYDVETIIHGMDVNQWLKVLNGCGSIERNSSQSCCASNVPERGHAPEVGGQPPLFISRLLREQVSHVSERDFTTQLDLLNAFKFSDYVLNE